MYGEISGKRIRSHTCMPKIVKMYENSSTSAMMYLHHANDITHSQNSISATVSQ